MYCDRFKYYFDRGHFWMDNNKMVTILADPFYNAIKRELKIVVKYCPFCGGKIE